MGFRPPKLPRLFRSGVIDLAALHAELFEERQRVQNERINEALAECGLCRYVDEPEIESAHEEALVIRAQRYWIRGLTEPVRSGISAPCCRAAPSLMWTSSSTLQGIQDESDQRDPARCTQPMLAWRL